LFGVDAIELYWQDSVEFKHAALNWKRDEISIYLSQSSVILENFSSLFNQTPHHCLPLYSLMGSTWLSSSKNGHRSQQPLELLIIVKIKPTVASILRVNHESFKTDSNKLRKNEEKKPPKYISSVISKITIFCPYIHPVFLQFKEPLHC